MPISHQLVMSSGIIVDPFGSVSIVFLIAILEGAKTFSCEQPSTDVSGWDIIVFLPRTLLSIS